MRKKKKSLIFIITLLILSFGIGYAYLTTTLSINGTTDIDSNNWDIYFDNVNVTTGSVSGEQVIEAPTITSDTTVEFHVRLKEPGDFYEFTVDAKNDGTIDAMINSVSKKINGGTTIPAYLNYTITYADNLEIQNNHLLAHESLETYKVRVEYRNDINPSDLPSTAQTITLSFGAEYIQADENAIEALQTYYSNNDYPVGSQITGNVYTDNSLMGNGVHFKYQTHNNIVKNIYLGFSVEGEKYYIQGAGASYNEETGTYNNDSPYYELNKSVLQTALDASNCNETVNSSCKKYECRINTNYYSADTQGNILISDYTMVCDVFSDGSTQCVIDS